MPSIQQETLDDAFNSDPGAWLESRACDGMSILLAHADDGVIWGEVREGRLVLAGNAFPDLAVELRGVTLQQARLFGPAGELRVWRTSDGTFKGALITDEQGETEPITEAQWLWGTPDGTDSEVDGFTLLREGAQGMLHAPPVRGLGSSDRVTLQVRHYLETDEQGVAAIGVSRLAGLSRVEDPNG